MKVENIIKAGKYKIGGLEKCCGLIIGVCGIHEDGRCTLIFRLSDNQKDQLINLSDEYIMENCFLDFKTDGRFDLVVA